MTTALVMHSENSQQGFVLSIGLHLAVAGTLAVFAWLSPFRDREPKIFEMIQIPRGSPGAAAPAEGTVTEFSLPEAQRPATPPPRQTPPPRTTPPPQVRPHPPTQPAPATARVVTPVKPPAKATPPSPKPPERVSYQDFVQQHGPPKPKAPRATASTPARNVPRIDTRFTTNLRDAVANPGSLTGMSDAQQTALGIYIGGLKDAIDRNWTKPTGLAQSTFAIVEFEVSSGGRVSDARIVQRSGNAGFDESVLAAFARVGSAGPTPDGKALSLRLTFRMKDE